MIVDEMLISYLALVPLLAERSTGNDCCRQCCACGALGPLVLVAPGYGGVWACSSCLEEAS